MPELTDTEIVAACARAIGVQPHPMWNAAKWPTPDFFGTHGVFNPLQDDAQAMALVKKLRLFIGDNHDVNAYKWLVFPAALVGIKHIEALDTDLNRAICLCAARVQIEKEKNA